MRLPICFRLTAVVSFGLMTLAVPVRAQELPPVPTPKMPETLGIYPGMSMQAAETQLQKHSADAFVQTNTLPLYFELTVSKSGINDDSRVYVTQSPNNPPAVWMIQRDWSNFGGAGITTKALVSALHQKYGQETMRKDHPDVTLYWIFDKDGRLLAKADPILMGCSGQNFIVKMNTAAYPGDQMPACFKGFFALTANFNPAETVNVYHLELVNLPFAVRAETISADAKKAAADHARQEQLKKASQNKPIL